MRAPKIKPGSVGPDAFIAVTVSWFGRAEARRIIKQSGCQHTEDREGFFSRRFTVRGDERQLQEFINIAWYSPDLGPSFQREIIGSFT